MERGILQSVEYSLFRGLKKTKASRPHSTCKDHVVRPAVGPTKRRLCCLCDTASFDHGYAVSVQGYIPEISSSWQADSSLPMYVRV